MKRLHSRVALAGLLVGLVFPGAALAQEAAAPRPSSCTPDFMGKASAAIKSYREKSKAPGVAVAFLDQSNACVLVDGVRRGKGPGRAVTPQTIFAMGSVQKVFNSIILAYEIAQGKAAIEDPAAKYLVAANGKRVSPGSAFARVTLKNLATHSSSLPKGQPNPPERDGWSLYRDRPLPPAVMVYLDSWQPSFPPGTRYQYSNLGFVLLGHAATTIGNKPYTELLAEVVTGPIGMTHTARPICDSPNPQCASGHDGEGQPAKGSPVGLWTTGEDMLRFLEANLGVLKLPDLQARAIDLTHQELFRENPNHAVGMAWEEWHSGDALLLSKNGIESGFTAWLAFQPTNHRGVAVLSNGAGPPPPANLGEELLKIAAGN